ncbi:hypothetical protein ACFQ3W_11315, partial [Paenibacillus puldeungensis]
DTMCDHAFGANGYKRNFAFDPTDDKQKIIPLYSSDISAAWEVVEKLQESQLYTDVRTCLDFYEVWVTVHEDDNQTETVVCPKLPEAICKAALLAVLEV